jgi:hypothetical protein
MNGHDLATTKYRFHSISDILAPEKQVFVHVPKEVIRRSAGWPRSRRGMAGTFAQVHQQVPGLLGGPCTCPVGGDAQYVHAARLDLHDEHLRLTPDM